MAVYDPKTLEWEVWKALTPTCAIYAPAMCFVSKMLICWCSEDSEFAALGIDTGFLLLGGGMSLLLSEGSGQSIDFARSITVEVLAVHILLECAWYGFMHKIVDPKATAKMSPDMWCHHIASVFAGLYCKAAGPFCWQVAMRLCTTECTIALPVAFKQAHKSNRLKGARSTVISLVMLLAYTWRVVRSAGCVLEFYNTMIERIESRGEPDPYWHFGLLSLAIVCMCNSYWLYKVVQGIVKHFSKSKKSA